MEARLFFISLWCGLYGFVLRALMKKEAVIRRPPVVMVLNSLFWSTGAAMLGMLLASYTENLDLTEKYSLVFAAGGLIGGAISGLIQSSKDANRSQPAILP